jgi:hypothetical protein
MEAVRRWARRLGKIINRQEAEGHGKQREREELWEGITF